MQKSIYPMLTRLAVVTSVLAGFCFAQQGSTAAPPSQAPKTSTAPSSSAAKTGTKPGAKAATTAHPAFTLKTQKDKESYALGMSIGTGLHKQAIPVDSAVVSRGLRDAMTGGKTLMTEEEMRSTLTQLQGEVRKLQDDKVHAAGATNRKDGEAFLAENKTKEGVVTLPDGLQYKILTAGTGPKPAATDTVTVNYRGTLINGQEFDSSKRGQPASFHVNGVIHGWTEALQLMPVGSKWQLFIPADLAYGDHSPDPSIGPGDTLIFEVELLSIGDQKK